MGAIIETYDLATSTYTRTVDGVATSRAMTAAEIANETNVRASQTASSNQGVLATRAQTALTTNATFLALGSPSNAQTLAQVQALTRECTALIRLLLGQLDSTAGT